MLSIGVHRGDVIYIGEQKLHVMDVRGLDYAKIWVNHKVFELSDQEAVEVLPGVQVSCGAPAKRETVYRKEGRMVLGELVPRLNFEAPLSVRILRSAVYEKMYAAA